MTRLELLGILYSIERMCEKKDYEGVELVVKKMISEAEIEKRPKAKLESD